MATRVSERSAFHSRPARAVLLDVSSSMDAEKMSVIQEALSQALTLFYHLKGPSRVTYFGLTVLEAFPEPVFPIQLLRNNFPRLQNAISELKMFSSHSPASRPLPHGQDNCIVQGIEEAMIQFRRVAQGFRQDSGSSFPSQLEVTLITARSQSAVQTAVDGSGGQLNVDCLSKIQVICVSSEGDGSDGGGFSEPVGGDGDEDLLDIDKSYPLDLNFTCSDISSSILDVCRVDCEASAVVAVLKHWVHETTGEQESVHIQLPSNDSSEPVVLKCDVMECVLDPTLIPMFQHHFSLKEVQVPAPTTSSRSAPGQQSVPGLGQSVRVLESVMVLPSDGVCESVLLGLPLVLRPTSCWKLDWEELENNSQNFTALCKLLREQDQMLVVAESPTPSSPVSPRGHFLILPSPPPSPFSLLIKPLVVSELYLHNTIPVSYEEPSCDAMLSMECVLNKVPRSELYNPLEVHSGLYHSLQIVSSKKGTSTRGGKGGGVTRRGGGVTGRGGGETGRGGGVTGRGEFSTGSGGPTGAKRRSQVQQQMEGINVNPRSLGPKRTKVSEFVGSTSLSVHGTAHRRSSRFPPPPPSGVCDDFEE